MATENPLRFVGSNGAGNWPLNKDSSEFTRSSNLVSEDLGLLLEGQRYHGNKSFGTNRDSVGGLGRSGSAPPSMEGSRAAFDILKSQTPDLGCNLENIDFEAQNCSLEEQHRAHPAYLAYYCANVNLNPRLPQPIVSRENRHMMQHIGAFGDNRRTLPIDDSSKASFFISRPALSTHNEEPEDDKSPIAESSVWMGKKADVPTHFTPHGEHMNSVDFAHEDFPQTSYPLYSDQSHPSNHMILEQDSNEDLFLNRLHDSVGKLETKASTSLQACSRNLGSNLIASMPSEDPVSTSVACSTFNERTLNLHPIQNESNSGTSFGSITSPTDIRGSSIVTIEDDLKKLKLSSDGHRSHQSRQYSQQVSPHSRSSSAHAQVGQMLPQGIHNSQNPLDHFSHGQPKLPSIEVQPLLQASGIAPLYVATSAFGSPYYHNLQSSSLFPSQFGVSGYTLNPSLVPPLVTPYPHHHNTIPISFENAVGPNFNARASGVAAGGNGVAGVDMQHLYKVYGQLGLAMQPPLPDPSFIPFYQNSSMDAYSTAGAGQYDTMISRGNTVGSLPGTYDLQQAPGSAAYLPDHRPQGTRVGGISNLNSPKGGTITSSYYGSPTNIGVLMQFPHSPVSPVFQGSPVAGTSFPGRKNDNIKFPFSSERNASSSSGWHSQRGREKVDDPKPYSFLEELKSNKARRYELSDVAGRVVEFSADQHGSRFIQQKLETCSDDEKASVFSEVLPHASSLMTDVFGNYVIQKFFEHGSTEQRKELANKLVGNVLPLSLQMYGCRVIQKALEVIELDQKTKLVQELDGNVMRCVRDQNGNHVIQKCIECIPTEKISFIISAFRGQVATLSTHPYGCRVIQRVLEHCTDESQSQCIVEEILQSVCQLAQDQYGNYVTQHVLERGKPQERSQIINKLFGQIVQMSQNKFASNVIEKCLAYGNTEERDLLIKEIVEQTEGNDNLLVMMKDQFANYVVQKILETCTDKQREILLNRIKIHLQALKKYTYGKHIVARVEQLCGEDAPDS